MCAHVIITTIEDEGGVGGGDTGVVGLGLRFASSVVTSCASLRRWPANRPNLTSFSHSDPPCWALSFRST